MTFQIDILKASILNTRVSFIQNLIKNIEGTQFFFLIISIPFFFGRGEGALKRIQQLYYYAQKYIMLSIRHDK